MVYKVPLISFFHWVHQCYEIEQVLSREIQKIKRLSLDPREDRREVKTKTHFKFFSHCVTYLHKDNEDNPRLLNLSFIGVWIYKTLI